MFEAYQRNSRPTVQPSQSTPQQNGRTRGPPSAIQTQGHGNVTSMYQSPVGQQPQALRGQEAAGAAWQQMAARRPQAQSPRQPSYYDQTPANRPGTSGSAGGRLSGDAHTDRTVHFTESIQGGGSPRSIIQAKDNARDNARDKYEENNFHYDRRARDRAQNHDRDRHREQDRDDHPDEDEHERRARERKKKASRTTKIGVSMLSLATLLETLDAVI